MYACATESQLARVCLINVRNAPDVIFFFCDCLLYCDTDNTVVEQVTFKPISIASRKDRILYNFLHVFFNTINLKKTCAKFLSWIIMFQVSFFIIETKVEYNTQRVFICLLKCNVRNIELARFVRNTLFFSVSFFTRPSTANDPLLRTLDNETSTLYRVHQG